MRFSRPAAWARAGSARIVPSLFVIRGNDQGARFELDTDVLTVGRDSTNGIQLHDTEVSRRHAELRREDRSLVIADLGSSNGTFVNGRRVETQSLASGDQLQLGSTLLLFTAPDEDSSRAAASRIDIIGRQSTGDSSRIVRSMRHDEGSSIFDSQAAVSESPWLARARSNLQIMYRTALAVSHTLDIDQLLGRIMELIFEWVEADRGCLMLIDAETKQLVPKVRRDRRPGESQDRLSISQTILDYVLEHNEGVLTSNAREDTRWNPAASILAQSIREAICVPMRGRYDVVGVIYIDTYLPPEQLIQSGRKPTRFTDEHLKLMIAIAHQAALAVEDTRHYSALVQAERLAAIGQTIAMLSHHIKNILQGIRGGSYLIDMGLSQHDENIIRKGWDIVEKNQGRISTLVMDMLTFSKEREPELKAANLNEVTADVVELMQARAADFDVSLTYEPAHNMPSLTFDHEGLHRAILNIVTNAIDACDWQDEEEHPPGRVTVRTEYDGPARLARVVVEDTGRGISAEDRERIFTLFMSKKGGRGTGLGLPVSNKILQEHGGRIVVDSTPGAGSRFTIELPAVHVEATIGPGK
jgi:signal transduction histidine kinase